MSSKNKRVLAGDQGAAKIRILKTEINDVGFDNNIFVNTMIGVSEKFDRTDLEVAAKYISDNIKAKQLFAENTNTNFMIRQLLQIGYVIIDDLDGKVANKRGEIISDTNIKIQLNKIACGIVHNYPANTDLRVKKLANKNYNFSDLSDYKVVLRKCAILHSIIMCADYLHSSNFSLSASPLTSHKYQLYKTAMLKGDKILSSANKYVKALFSTELMFSNVNILIMQLQSTNLLEILNCVITGKGEEDILETQFAYYITDQYNKIRMEKYYRSLNEFNAIYTLVTNNPKSYSSIIDKITKYNIKNLDILKTHLTQEEFNKLYKLIKYHATEANTCAHNNDFARFYELLDKQYRGIKDEVMKELASLKDYIQEIPSELHADREAGLCLYRCKKCDQFLYCGHHIDFLGNTYEERQAMIEKYRDSVIKDSTVFCRICGEKIFRNQSDEIVSGDRFNAIAHARAIDRQNDTELPIVRGITFTTLSNLLSLFVFKYEYSRVSLIKTIQDSITMYVIYRMHKMKISISDPSYKDYAELFTFIYGFIYMMDIFIEDNNVILKSVDSVIKRDINQYTSHFGGLTFDRFKRIIPDKQILKRYIFEIYTEMKRESKSEVIYFTQSDFISDIISNPLYMMLFHMYEIAKGKILSPVLEFRNIILNKEPKVENFLVDSWRPKAADYAKFPITLATYEYIMDFESPRNNMHDVKDIPHLSSAKEFDPKVRDYIRNYANKIIFALRRNFYINIMSMPFNFNSVMRDGVPVSLIYTAEGKPIEWVPIFADGKIKDYAAKVGGEVTKLTISQLSKADNNAISAARYKEIGYKLAKLAEAKIPKYVKTVANKDYKFGYNDNIFQIITKINPKFDINQMRYIGQSDGLKFSEFIKGNIIYDDLYAGNNDIRLYRLNYYLCLFIQEYNNLRFRHTSLQNIKYFELAKKRDKILEYNQDIFPDIGSDKFFEEYKQKLQTWKPYDVYGFMQIYFCEILELLHSKKDPVINEFLIIKLSEIFNMDRLYSKGDIISAAGDIEVDDDDMLDEKVVGIDIDEDALDAVDTNEIDFDAPEE